MPHILSYLVIALFGLFSMALEPAFAEGSSDGSSESEAALPAYAEAKAAVASQNFPAALPILMQLTAAEPKNADAWNLLGYTHRKLGQFDEAGQAYDRALSLNPGHLGALEYQGELFLQISRADLAQANLAKLQNLCGSCEEATDLQAAIAAAQG